MGDLARLGLKTGEGFEPSSRLSLGQRCTCVFPILLLLEGTLLMDQPEDNLHNKFIFEVLVPSISEAKKRRQLLFATHNANLIVLDPADRVFALAAKDERGRLDSSGDVDEMRDPIEKLVEGGREAFVLRGERYGHMKPGAKSEQRREDGE